MHLLDAQQELLCNIDAGNATMFESGSGMGKSSIILDTFNKLAAGSPKGEWGLGISFAATMTPIDTIGVPFKGTRSFELPDGTTREITVTDPSVPLWMISTEGKPAHCYRRFFLFIDEYGQGESDTKRGLSEIFLSGGTGYWRLPDGSVRVAATNVGSRYGVTKDFDFAIARRTKLKISPNIDVLLKYLDKPYNWAGKSWQTMAVTKAWAATHTDVVFESEPKEQGPWCSPRTLCSFDRYLQCKLTRTGKLDTSDPAIIEVGEGTVGMAATQSIVSHLQFQLELPRYEDVVRDPHNTELPSSADKLMLMAYELAARAQVPDLPAVLAYVTRIGSKAKDMEVTFVSALLRRDYKGMLNQPAMQAWISKNATLVSIIATLAQ